MVCPTLSPKNFSRGLSASDTIWHKIEWFVLVVTVEVVTAKSLAVLLPKRSVVPFLVRVRCVLVVARFRVHLSRRHGLHAATWLQW